MRMLLLTAAGLGMMGLSLATTSPALASETTDQAAAESFVQTTPSQTPQVPGAVNGSVAGSYVGGPANPNNGLAQDRISGAQVQ